jgi:hypothetical protein
MDTVDDKGPIREFLRLLVKNVVECSGVFHETANKGAYVLTHNANKLNSHVYYMAGRAFAMSLIFGEILHLFFHHQFMTTSLLAMVIQNRL